jgi:hypothetical protein
MSATSDIAAKKWARTIQDIQKKSYWVIGLLLLGFSAYFYYTSLNKPVAGVLWFIGGFLIVYYYWLKWFVLDRPYDPDFFTGSGACPDYLSVIPNNSGLYMPTSTTQYFCVDFVGVSRNGGIRKMNRNSIVSLISLDFVVMDSDAEGQGMLGPHQRSWTWSESPSKSKST